MVVAFLLATAALTAAPALWVDSYSLSTQTATGRLSATVACSSGAAATADTWAVSFGSLAPGSATTCTYTLRNPAQPTSTTPWRVEEVFVNGTAVNCTAQSTCTYDTPTYTLTFANPRGCYAAPGQTRSGAFTIQVKPGAATFVPASLSAAFTLHQWNGTTTNYATNICGMT